MNKQVKLLLVVTALIFVSFKTAKAQTISTQGKEFWVSFMANGYKYHPDAPHGNWILTQVLISAKHDCSGTVSNPNTGWNYQFNVRANDITTVEIPEEEAYHEATVYERIVNKGILIQTTDTVSVYCTNIAHVSFDASYVLPIEGLADSYLIQTYDQSTNTSTSEYVNSHQTSAFVIIATEDNTTIDITPTVPTLGGRPAGEEFSVTLNKGQAYQVRSTLNGTQRDLSGTLVTSRDCKKIAVFNGNTVTCIPRTKNSFDHIFEQAMPIRAWGKNFVVTQSLDRDEDYVKITSAVDNNTILKNGETLCTLQSNESFIFPLSENEKSCYLEASGPSAVFLYNTSCERDFWGNSTNGDPSVVWIAPIEQRINDVTFSTFDDPHINIAHHYVNIIINTEDINKVYLDGSLISPLLFRQVSGNEAYSYARIEIENAVHHLSCINGFNAHIYGFGAAKGYAYLVGSNASDLTCNTTINGIEVKPNETFHYCVDESATFSAEVNYQEYSLQWDFGDGTTSTQNPANHTYSNKSLYNAKLIVTVQGGTCDGSATETIPFFVDVRQNYLPPIYDELCYGDGYYDHGLSVHQILDDTILGTAQANPTFSNCQDSLLIYLTVRQPDHVHFDESTCWRGHSDTYTGHGFVIQYDHPGTFSDHHELPNVFGCDSVATITLTVSDRITKTLNEHCCESSYYWDGSTYSQPGTYEKQYVSTQGCDSIVTLNLTFGHPQTFAFDTIVCGTFTWNGQEYQDEPGYHEYIQKFQTFDGCDSTVIAKVNLSDVVDGPTEEASGCNSHPWNGEVYTIPGTYSANLTSQFGCDSIAHLELHMNYTPSTWGNPGEEIYAHDTLAAHQVITATEFQIFTYTYSIQDKNPYCHWDSVVWSIHSEEGEAVDWVLEPFVDKDSIVWSAELSVFKYIPGRIIINATAYNECEKQGILFQNWVVCSFFGVDEAEYAADIRVVPNPNNGEMNLQFFNTDGSTEVTVYDMSGTLIDRFMTNANNYRYTLKQHTAGIYLFVFNYKGKIITRKVCIG